MKRILMSVLAIGAVVAMIGGATFAWFSDGATSNQSSFSAGTLSIDDAKVVGTARQPIINMAPGQVSPEYSVIIENNGTINLGWVADWEFSGGVRDAVDLKNALYINSAKMEFLAPNSKVWTTEDQFITAGTGSGSYPTAYNALAALSSFNVISLNNWNGNNSMGSAPYEHMGALKPGYSYRLTVTFGFAEQAGDPYQGIGPVTAQLNVKAAQINVAALQQTIGTVAGPWDGHVTWMNAQITDQTER